MKSITLLAGMRADALLPLAIKAHVEPIVTPLLAKRLTAEFEEAYDPYIALAARLIRSPATPGSAS